MQKKQTKSAQPEKFETFQDDFAARHVIDAVFQDLTRMADCKINMTGLATGFTRLDTITAGLQKSDLIVLASHPHMGKTALALNIALHTAINVKIPVVIFSLQTCKKQLMQRMLAMYAQVNLSTVQNPSLLEPEEWERLFAAANVFHHAPIFIDDTATLNIMELRSRAQRLKAEHNLCMIIIDSLQYMCSDQRIELCEYEISRALKSLAEELHVPVFASLGIDRKMEDYADKKFKYSHLHQFEFIKQYADVCMSMNREDVYAFPKAAERPSQGIAEIIVEKNRNRPTGTVELLFNTRIASFENMQ